MKLLAGRLRDCTLGAAAVEFAIISMVLIALLIGMIDFGRTLFTQHQISSLADQAVRKVLLNPGISSATLESELRAEFTAGNADDLAVGVTSETADGISYRVVTIGYPMLLFVPGLDSDTLSLNVTRLRNCTAGAAAVEFAIISTVLVALLVGTVDFGRTLFTQHQIASLADEAVRKILLNPGISSATLESELRAEFTAGNPDELAVATTIEAADGISYRVVTVGYPMLLFIPVLDSDAVSLSVTRRVPAG